MKRGNKKGFKHSKETIEKIRLSHIGKVGGFKNKHHSSETKERIKNAQLGKLNHNWKGGKNTENHKIRISPEIDLWRKACLERDNFTCQKTGQYGGKLQVHHINNFADFPELRLAIDNGVTLSEKAHREFHKVYGRKNNTREQLLEFLLDNVGRQ